MRDSIHEQSLNSLKDSLVDLIIITGTTLGTLVFVIAMIPFEMELINRDFFTDLAAILALFLTYFFRNKLTVQFKTNVVIGMAYLIFLSDLVETGLHTQDIILVVIIPFLSILIYNVRITTILFALCMLTVLVVGKLYQIGILTSPYYDNLDVDYLRWIEIVLMNTVVIFIITVFLYRFDRKIYSLIRDLNAKNDYLSEREFLLSTIKDNFPRSYMSVIDSEFIIRMTGGSEFKTNDLSPDQFNGKLVKEVFEPFGVEALNKILNAYKKTLAGEAQVFEIKLGDEYQIYKTMPLPDIDGEIKSFLSVVENITESVESKHLIEENLHEKNVLLQEIHHRVKNNLAVVSGLLTLQSFSINDENSKHILEKSTNRILSIAKVHEMLYESNNFNKIPFDEYLNELYAIILNSMNSKNIEIDFKTNISVDFITINHGVPLGIIFNELITNSIQYAVGEKSALEIEISVKKIANEVYVEYRDNGAGIKDFKSKYPKKLGFQLIDSLFQQIEATFTYHTENRFKLNFNFPCKIES